MRSLYALVLCCLGLATPALGAGLPSSPAGILDLMRATKQLEIDPGIPRGARDRWSPWVRLAHAAPGTSGGFIAAAYAQRGTLTDGTHVLSVPLDSGGSGGVFTQVLFAQKGHSAAHYAGYVSSGGHVGVRVKDGAIVVQFADYGPTDPNCCPSHYLHQRYTVRNGALLRIATWRTTKPE